MRDHDHHLTDEDLLRALDHELSPRRQASADAHLAWCPVCQARRAQFDRAAARFAASYESDRTIEHRPAVHPRERLRAALHETAGTWGGSRRGWLSARVMLAPRWLAIGAAAAAAAFLVLRLADRSLPPDPRPTLVAVERDALPVASLTPGATWNLSLEEVCTPGAREERQIAAAVRQRVLRDYGMEHVPQDEYELDHLITPELGGAPDPRNLWPQRYTSRVWNAHVKDQLEQLLPRLVCDGEVALETAQHDIALDWIAAYKKYFKTAAPLRTGADRLTDDDLADRFPEVFTYPVRRSADAPGPHLISFASRP
jgi:anti-sigma factor RsiW